MVERWKEAIRWFFRAAPKEAAKRTDAEPVSRESDNQRDRSRSAGKATVAANPGDEESAGPALIGLPGSLRKGGWKA